MTAITGAQVPSSITTVEQMHAWTGTILNDLYLAQTAIEDTGTAARVAQQSAFLVTATQTPQWRLVNRTSLALNANWRRSGRLWLSVATLGNSAIPSEYLS